MRVSVVLTALLLALTAPVAVAQQGQESGPFGPLPPAAPAPTATPTPDPTVEAQEQTDRTLLYIIGAGLLVLFVVIARVITRDARKTLHQSGRDAPPRPREAGPYRHKRQSKSKARAKTRAQRRARKQNR